MDSKVQKAVFNNIDQLLSKIEDQCDVPKLELWTLWKSMFNFPEEVQKKPRKVKAVEDQKDAPLIKTPEVKAPQLPPAPKKTQTVKTFFQTKKVEEDILIEEEDDQTARKLSFPPKVESPKPASPKVESPQAIAPKPVSPQAIAPKPVSPKVESPQAIAPKAESPKVASPQAIAPKPVSPQAIAPKAESSKEESKEEDIVIEEEEPAPVQKQKEKSTGCVFPLTKGVRKGEKCGDKVGKNFTDIRMCAVHGKKQ